MKKIKRKIPLALIDTNSVDWRDVESCLIGNCIDDLWRDEDGTIFRYSCVYGLDIVNPNWVQGCCICEAYRDTIERLKSKQGTVKACAYALAYLKWSRPRKGYLCRECMEGLIVQ